MKIIFLDIDGPLAYGTYKSGRVMIEKGLTIPYSFVQEDCDALRDIIAETGASIVLSSDWRLVYPIDSMNAILSFYGVPPKIIDRTDSYKAKMSSPGSMDRAYQIMDWVENNNPTSWVAIDDYDLSYYFVEKGYDHNFVHVRGDNNKDKTVSLQSVKQNVINLLNTNNGIL